MNVQQQPRKTVCQIEAMYVALLPMLLVVVGFVAVQQYQQRLGLAAVQEGAPCFSTR